MTQTQLGTYDYIPVDAIRASATNPRKTFDEAALNELASSIREVGVKQPIVVRPLLAFRVERVDNIAYRLIQNKPHAVIDTFDNGTAEENLLDAQARADELNGSTFTDHEYEIVAGERRFRATLMAELDEIPAIVRDMTDSAAQELQLIENLQRADLHPVEEAEGYRQLCAGGATVEDLAKRAGKTTAYVQQRLKLLTLELPAKLLFHAGHLTLGHALMLARLTTKDQDRAVRNLLGANHLPAKEDMVAYATRRIEEHKGRDHTWRLVKETEAQLREWISSQVMLSLAKVPWSLEDPKLVPEAGPCTTCPKRTGSNAALFADLTVDEDVCLDASCYATKQKAIQVVTIQASAAAGKPLIKLSAKSGHKPLEELTPGKTIVKQGQWVAAKHNSCPSTTKGILIDEPSRYDQLKKKPGEVMTVCADQKCKVHKHTVETVSSTTSRNGNHPANVAERETKEKAYVEAETPIRAAIIQAIEDNAATGIHEVRSVVFAHCRNYARICDVMGWEYPKAKNTWEKDNLAQDIVEKQIETATITMLGRIALIDALSRDLRPSGWQHNDRKSDRKHLWAIAEHYDVDADEIAARVEAERKPKAEPKPAAAPAKPGKTKLSVAAQTKRKAAAAKKFPAKMAQVAQKVAQNKAGKGKLVQLPAKTAIDGKSAGAGVRPEQEAS